MCIYTMYLVYTLYTADADCFTCVYVGVFLHVRLLVKTFATVLTRIRSRVAVNEQMR